MANYALTVTPKFTPFTYDELVKPVEAYQKVYDAYNEKYDEIEDEISKYKNLEQSDPGAYSRYADYVNKLQTERDSLMKKGLSTDTRRNFSDLRRQYSEQIVPLTEAEKRKKELVKNYEDMKKTNPTLLTDVDPREIKLSQLIENPNMGFESYSGNLLQAQMENQMSALADDILSNPVKWMGATMKQHYGFTYDEVVKALKNPYDQKSTNIINHLANKVFESSGILNWNTSDDVKQKAYNWAMQGAMKGVGKDIISEDFYAREKERRRTLEEKDSRRTLTGFSLSSAPAVASSLNSYLPAPPSTASYKVNGAHYNQLVKMMKDYNMKITNAGQIDDWGKCPPEAQTVISGMITNVLTPLGKSSNNNVDLNDATIE